MIYFLTYGKRDVSAPHPSDVDRRNKTPLGNNTDEGLQKYRCEDHWPGAAMNDTSRT